LTLEVNFEVMFGHSNAMPTGRSHRFFLAFRHVSVEYTTALESKTLKLE